MPRSKHVFLMCPPEYFTVAYIINPWMHGNLRRIENGIEVVMQQLVIW